MRLDKALFSVELLGPWLDCIVLRHRTQAVQKNKFFFPTNSPDTGLSNIVLGFLNSLSVRNFRRKIFRELVFDPEKF